MNGTYCYSNDAATCQTGNSRVGLTCDLESYFGCAWGPDGVTFAEGTYCITNDNLQCLSD